MVRRVVSLVGVAAALVVLQLALASGSADACGGLFCQNDPVDQAGERIVFTVNSDDTITSLIEIQYQGSADDFSWILPIPEAITADDLQVPEEGQQVFTDLHQATDVRFIRPDDRDCRDPEEDFSVMADSASDASEESDAGVEVFASGEVGPFAFDVVGSSDPDALTNWLRDNEYRVEPFMEPLIATYVEEEFAFVAMQLIDGESADSIAPIEITYGGEAPMIPLRLTAVAANPNMPIWVWIFADEQAVPDNYEEITIDTRELTFQRFGQTDYLTLVPARADALGGRAFITEFAGPASSIDLNNNYIRNRRDRYLTRVYTRISPDEMTVDPVFGFDGSRDDVSNVRDASRLSGLYSCERDSSGWFRLSSSDALDPYNNDGSVVATTPTTGSGNVVLSWLVVVGVLAGSLGFLAWLVRSNSAPQTSAPEET